jgi:threonine dehydrogenase-like Zn-dependent dehydrogenase
MQSSYFGWCLVVVFNSLGLHLYPLFMFVQYPTCLDLLEEKKINCEPLITHRFGFSEKDIINGFETAAAAGKTGAIKVMFNW